MRHETNSVNNFKTFPVGPFTTDVRGVGGRGVPEILLNNPDVRV